MLGLLTRVLQSQFTSQTGSRMLLMRSLRSFADRYSTYRDVVLKKDDIEKTYMRSSGPGGQHVNTTNSKAEIRIQLSKCTWIDEYIRQRMKQSCRLTKDGYLTLTSQVHRQQDRNLEQCYRKLQKIIYENSIIMKERRFDIPPETEELRRRRVQEKRHKGQIKRGRQSDDRDYR